jgi:hypothetical protein
MSEPAPQAPAPVPAAEAAPTGDVVARADSWERKKWILMGLFMIGYGLYSLYHGYYHYPRMNQEAVEEARRQGKPDPEKLPHGGLDIPFNRVTGWALQPLGLLAIWWAVHRSRGEYRLSGDTLHVPGHPPVPLDAIRAIDTTKRERKGIVYIDYEVNGTAGRLKLDDYLYQRKPTETICDQILAAVAPEEAQAAADATDRSPSA